MKKVILLVIATIMLVSASFELSTGESFAASDQKVEAMSFYPYPAMKSIKIKWKKKDNVEFYEVYRVDLKKKKNRTPDISRYEKVGTVSGSKSSWADKDVRKNNYYGYVVRGYKLSEENEPVLAYDSYMEGDCDYACANLDRPEVFNGGNGEFEANSKDRLYIYVQRDSGVRPDGVEVYRKAEGDSEYKKIKVKKAEEGKFDQGKPYVDAGVKPGETYYYKVRTYKRFLFIKKYSSYSKTIEIPAVNFKGIYEAEAVTSPGTVEGFVVKLTGKKYNGALTIKPAKGDISPLYSTDGGTRNYDDQKLSLAEYSCDNKNWKKIPASGFTTKGGQTCYLKFRFIGGEGYFGGNNGTYSTIYMEECVRYDGSAGFGSANLTIELTDGKAEAFSDYDN